MKKIMKSPAIKTIVVRITAKDFEFKIDTSIFDDPFMEAATRAIEHLRKETHAIIAPVIKCWEVDTPKKMQMYNSYWVLVNASCFNKAERLREKFKLQCDCDLAKEPLHGKQL